MLQFTTNIGAYIGLWFVLVKFIAFAFRQMEESTTDVHRDQLFNQITSSSWAERLGRWPSTFLEVFDSIFGKKHLSWHTFGRSCVASTLGVLLLTGLWAAIHTEQFLATLEQVRPHGVAAAVSIGLFVAFINFPADYVCLLETRYVVKKMADKPVPRRIIALVLADFLITPAIWLLFLLTAVRLFGGSGTPKELLDMLSRELLLESSELGGPPGTIFLYSSYVTSVWVWMHASARGALGLARQVDRVISTFRKGLDVRHQPYIALGVAWQKLVHAVFVVGLPVAIIQAL